MKIETKDLTPALWPDVEKLFGANGACGGCWCQAWRIEKGEKWEKTTGAVAKRRLRDGISASDVRGVLAYETGEPVGWCTFGPRPTFPRLNRAPSLACDDAERVWSLPCFFVKSGHRGRGVAGALLRRACDAMKRAGAATVEGYPVKETKDGKPLPGAFAWTGTRSLFRAAGFRPAGPDGFKQRFRRKP
jgi:GNAT superfamily N-acetyltransferase